MHQKMYLENKFGKKIAHSLKAGVDVIKPISAIKLAFFLKPDVMANFWQN
jgi:hypothetical protein